ncbi:MAG: hypothetical protein JRJ29_20960 [Deltaproteobacteria bacterium]|nr:hypothetical protein [Deltaproteobacteria bacterium]
MAEEVPKLKFKIPQVGEVEGYAVEMPDGTIELRTKEQLEAMPKPPKEGESGGETTSKED